MTPRILWTEVRCSPLRWWLPLLALLDLAVLFGRARWWVGEWPQASVETQITAFYIAPLVAASAAWSAGRRYRDRTASLVEASARPAWQVEATQVAAAVIYGIGVYTIGAAVAAGFSLVAHGDGFLWPGYIALGGALIVGSVAFGHLAGTWSTGQFLAPVSTALATFVVIAWLGRGLGLFVLNGAPDLAPAVPAVLWRVAAAVAAVVLAVTVSRPRGAIRWSRGGLRLAAGVSALAFAATLAGAGSAGAVQAPRTPPASAEATCTGGHPSICLWPDDQKYLPQARAMAARLQVLQAEGIEVSDTYFERGLRGSDPNGLDFYILEGSLWDPAETIGGEIEHNAITAACSLRLGTDDPSGLQAAGELSMWLAMRVFGGGQPGDMHGGPPDVDLSAVAGLLHESESAQLQWYQQRLAMARAAFCG